MGDSFIRVASGSHGFMILQIFFVQWYCSAVGWGATVHFDREITAAISLQDSFFVRSALFVGRACTEPPCSFPSLWESTCRAARAVRFAGEVLRPQIRTSLRSKMVCITLQRLFVAADLYAWV